MHCSYKGRTDDKNELIVHTGREEQTGDWAGQLTCRSKRQRETVVNSVAFQRMVVRRSLFHREEIHETTWRSLDQRAAKQIDYVLALITRTCRSASINLDHYPIAVTMRFHRYTDSANTAPSGEYSADTVPSNCCQIRAILGDRPVLNRRARFNFWTGRWVKQNPPFCEDAHLS